MNSLQLGRFPFCILAAAVFGWKPNVDLIYVLLCLQDELDAIFVNATLSGVQQRNLEVSATRVLEPSLFPPFESTESAQVRVADGEGAGGEEAARRGGEGVARAVGHGELQQPVDRERGVGRVERCGWPRRAQVWGVGICFRDYFFLLSG